MQAPSTKDAKTAKLGRMLEIRNTYCPTPMVDTVIITDMCGVPSGRTGLSAPLQEPVAVGIQPGLSTESSGTTRDPVALDHAFELLIYGRDDR